MRSHQRVTQADKSDGGQNPESRVVGQRLYRILNTPSNSREALIAQAADESEGLVPRDLI